MFCSLNWFERKKFTQDINLIFMRRYNESDYYFTSIDIIANE